MAGVAPLLAAVASFTPAEHYAMDVLTVPASLAGLPALSLPSRLSRREDLPIGMQLIAPRFEEYTLLQVGREMVRNSGNIQGTFKEHAGNIQGTFRDHSGNVPRGPAERWYV
jgi:Asp-tRNA(Asn)/Glu-tRNA(Gln) amidotransferase A subunit family amidase